MNNKVYRKIDKVSGNVITLKAEGVRYGELAELRSKRGLSLAEVIHLDDDQVHLQVFAGSLGVSTEDEVKFLEHGMHISFSDNLFGRIFNGSGQPIDRGPILMDEMIEIKTPSINPARRRIPSRMIHTKIPMIDVFNSLVVSQKLPIFSVSGEDYNPLLARIAMQAEVEVIIIGGMGLKYDDFLYFKNKLEESGARKRTIFFVHTAADPVAECLLVPDLALAVGERFALKGRDVLVLLTDMNNYAEALKEIAITMEQVPSNRGYPGDLYSRLAARYEKAVDFVEAGSVTILATTTMPGDDITHPVPDNTGYITEGQLYLRDGRINPFGSLSRLKHLVNKNTREDHRELMDAMIRLYAQANESREKKALGFTMTEWDTKLLHYGKLFEDRMMDLSVSITLEEALDLGWKIFADCFTPEEVAIRSDLIQRYWTYSIKEKK